MSTTTAKAISKQFTFTYATSTTHSTGTNLSRGFKGYSFCPVEMNY
jgi:hypothetical protein